MSFLFLALVPVLTTFLFTYALPEVDNLRGEGHFRSLTLHWTFDGSLDELSGFLVYICEDQSWGKYKCRSETYDHTEVNEIRKAADSPRHEYEVTLMGLRMATNYSIHVAPIAQGAGPVAQKVEDPVEQDRNAQYGRSMGREIIVQTKGFSARATNCLANSSVVQVNTGPYFGGMVSVEDSTDPRCSTHGNKTSKETSYLLTIDHNLCRSEVHNTSVRTFIVVQENLPILTHSTRRFLVVCNYVPETFTVRAGVSLPDSDDADDAILTAVDQSVREVDPSELFDAANNIFDSRLSQDVGRALKMSAEKKDKDPELWAHLVMMVLLVAAAVVGTSCAVWYFVQHSRTRHRQGFMTPQEEPRGLEFGNHMEDAVRDYTQGTAPPPPPPPAVLTSFIDPDGPESSLSDLVYDLTRDPADDVISATDSSVPDDVTYEGLVLDELPPAGVPVVVEVPYTDHLPPEALNPNDLDPLTLGLGAIDLGSDLPPAFGTVAPPLDLDLDLQDDFGESVVAFSDDPETLAGVHHSPVFSSVIYVDPSGQPAPLLQEGLQVVEHPAMAINTAFVSSFSEEGLIGGPNPHIRLNPLVGECDDDFGSDDNEEGSDSGDDSSSLATESSSSSEGDDEAQVPEGVSDGECLESMAPRMCLKSSLPSNWTLSDGQGQHFPSMSS